MKSNSMINAKTGTSYSIDSHMQDQMYKHMLTFPVVKKRKVVLLGATGSIGSSTIKVLREHRDRLELIGIAADRSAEPLLQIAQEFDVPETVLFSREGVEGLERLASLPEADVVLVATTGTAALRPVLAALSAGKDIALANKEILVVGGHLLTAAAAVSDGRIYPVDSEHNAIFQCLEGNTHQGHIRRILLTASGGPFRETPAGELEHVTVEDALRHPTWSMGRKITVDSATLANKGLEMIEASRLFNVGPDQIEVVVHPQSIVHSMVEFSDYSVIAQMSTPSMTFAIQHVLLYPERIHGVHEPLDFTKGLSLDFGPPDETRFPCLRLARESLEAGGFYSAVFNIADEVAVDAFLNRRLTFTGIPELITATMEKADGKLPLNVEDLLDAEAETRLIAQSLLK